jgi:hypothetical protein
MISVNFDVIVRLHNDVARMMSDFLFDNDRRLDDISTQVELCSLVLLFCPLSCTMLQLHLSLLLRRQNEMAEAFDV